MSRVCYTPATTGTPLANREVSTGKSGADETTKGKQNDSTYLGYS